METVYFLGIDISKKTFNAALTCDGQNMPEMEVTNRAQEIRAFFSGLKTKVSLSQLIVCMEHTGIYCLPILDYLVKHNIKVCVEPGLQIKQSQGITRGKNDKIDARRIAQYAFKNRNELAYWTPQRPILQKLKALLILRERLIKTKNQLEVPISESKSYVQEELRKSVAKRCTSSIAAINKDIKSVDQDIKTLIKVDQQVHQQMKWATSVPGVGNVTALNVILATDEFKRISIVKKFACYSGIAPFEHRSGSSIRGKTRVSKMANMRIKTLLTLGSMSVVQRDQELKLYFERKMSQGKNYWSVINAVRNKLISRIFACVQQQKVYQKNYANALA